ncbi:diguanylate cyclase [Paraburkholderia sp. UCT2]|nr:diguanylate cyclase [Paraburkholderia sp. UCT2]
MERHGVTLSTGVATNTKAEPLASVIERADAAIDDAKQAGRNTVVLA